MSANWQGSATSAEPQLTNTKANITYVDTELSKKASTSVVDGVTSVCAMECRPDEWGIDVLVSGSQKGFMIPPGLAFLTASERAWKVYEECKHPSFYWDWAAYKKSVQGNSTPFTPAVNLFVGLDKALEMIKVFLLTGLWLIIFPIILSFCYSR